MPVDQIDIQPVVDSIVSAYRPILFNVRVTSVDAPPVVYCDIYIDEIYYKTSSKTQPKEILTGYTVWEFDIQDAIQEVMKKYIGANGASNIILLSSPIKQVYCKFRSSTIDPLTAFTLPDPVAPIQATGLQEAVSGDGIQSNEFTVLNATLQQEDNQDLYNHLYANGGNTSTFINGVSAALTNRKESKININESDYFPIISRNDLSCIVLKVVYKDGTEFTSSCASTVVGEDEETVIPTDCDLVVEGLSVEFDEGDSRFHLNFNVPAGGGSSTLNYVLNQQTALYDQWGFTLSGAPIENDIAKVYFILNDGGGDVSASIFSTFTGSITTLQLLIDNLIFKINQLISGAAIAYSSGGNNGSTIDGVGKAMASLRILRAGAAQSTLDLGGHGNISASSWFFTLKGTPRAGDTVKVNFYYDDGGGPTSGQVTSTFVGGWSLSDMINDLYTKIHAINVNTLLTNQAGFDGVRTSGLTIARGGVAILANSDGAGTSNPITSITVEYSTNGGTSWTNAAFTYNSSTGEIIITSGLSEENDYVFRVTPLCSSGEGVPDTVNFVGTGATNNFGLTYTNNEALEVSVLYGDNGSSPSNTLISPTIYSGAISGNNPALPLTNGIVQLHIDVDAGQRIISANANGSYPADTISDYTATWDDLTGDVFISFITEPIPAEINTVLTNNRTDVVVQDIIFNSSPSTPYSGFPVATSGGVGTAAIDLGVASTITVRFNAVPTAPVSMTIDVNGSFMETKIETMSLDIVIISDNPYTFISGDTIEILVF